MEFVIFRVIFSIFLAITALSVRTTSALELQKNSGKQLNASPQPDESTLSWDRAAGLRHPAFAWPYAVVPFTITAGFDQDHINLIKSAMVRISQKSCVIFSERSNEADYVSIEIGMDGCYSDIGRKGGYQQLSLEIPGCGDHFGVVIHELLHVLGLVHEQSRPDRDKYVNIVMENVQEKPEYKRNFFWFDWDMIQNLTVPYDLKSVMHYNPYAFTKNGKKTIIPKGYGMIPNNVNDMSPGDVAFINIMYCYRYVE